MKTSKFTAAEVFTLLREKNLGFAGLSILFYVLASSRSSEIMVFDHATINTILGIGRTSFFEGMKQLRHHNLLHKRGKNKFQINPSFTL